NLGGGGDPSAAAEGVSVVIDPLFEWNEAGDEGLMCERHAAPGVIGAGGDEETRRDESVNESLAVRIRCEDVDRGVFAAILTVGSAHLHERREHLRRGVARRLVETAPDVIGLRADGAFQAT